MRLRLLPGNGFTSWTRFQIKVAGTTISRHDESWGFLLKLKKYIVPVCLFSLIALMIRECSMAEWDAQEAKVKELIERRVSKEEVIAALGKHFVDYSRGGPNENALKESFSREPDKLLEVQDKAKKWPNIIYYSTPDIMTWLFLDEHQRLVDYAMSAQ